MPELHFSMEQNKMDHLLLKSPVLKLNLKTVEERTASYSAKYLDLPGSRGFVIWGNRFEKAVTLKH